MFLLTFFLKSPLTIQLVSPQNNLKIFCMKKVNKLDKSVNKLGLSLAKLSPSQGYVLAQAKLLTIWLKLGAWSKQCF